MALIRVQTVTHILQTGSPGYSYTHQQLTFYYKHLCILSGNHREKRFVVPIFFPPSMEAAGVNRPQQICCVNRVADIFSKLNRLD